MKWVKKIKNAKMIAYSQFPIGAALFIVVTPQTAPYLDLSEFSDNKYLGMDVRVFNPSATDHNMPAIMIGSDTDPCLAVSVLFDGAIVIAECD